MAKHIHIHVHDSSPEMEAFRARQAERKRTAEEGIAKAEKLLSRATEAVKKVKKNEGTLVGRPANIVHQIKMVRASYSLAINALSNSQEFDRWLAKANQEFSQAESDLQDVERRAAMR